MHDRRRNWVGKLLLRAPRHVRSIRNIPVIGDIVHRLSHRVLPNDEKVWAKIEDGPSRGLWIELNPRTGQSYFRGDTEMRVQNTLAENLRPGMIFYDLGANIGLFSMLAARAVGPTGHVFSFEPDLDIAARLRRNVERNELQNVTIVPKGVWSGTKRQAFAPSDSSSPDHGTGRFLVDGKPADTVLLECVALDDFVREAPVPQAIKCDVEGAELEVLRGAENMLRAYRPWILCETHSEANDHACREILGRFGYSLSPVDDLHVLATRNPEGKYR
jgi:FkbM family methyltransferase